MEARMWKVSLMVLTLILVCFEGICATYEKASENQLKVTESVETETIMTPEQIQHEIDGCNYDIKNLDDQHARAITEITIRKSKLEAMLAECEKLEIKKAIILDTPTEPINPPLTDDEI